MNWNLMDPKWIALATADRASGKLHEVKGEDQGGDWENDR
jgi:hypothetical protein